MPPSAGDPAPELALPTLALLRFDWMRGYGRMLLRCYRPPAAVLVRALEEAG